MARIFRYEVNYYNEYENEEKVDKGIVAAENYSDAVSKLCSTDEYGEDSLSYVKVWDCYETVLTDADLMLDLRK